MVRTVGLAAGTNAVCGFILEFSFSETRCGLLAVKLTFTGLQLGFGDLSRQPKQKMKQLQALGRKQSWFNAALIVQRAPQPYLRGCRSLAFDTWQRSVVRAEPKTM
jgi:hypothetical protein